MKRAVAFFKQPLNQGALVALGGMLLAWASGQTTWQATAVTAAGAIVAWVIPDNSVAKEDVEALVKDAIKVAGDLASKQGVK